MPLVPVKPCIVPGKPVGKARPRLGRGGRVYTPTATIKAERAIAAAWRAQVGIKHTGPVHVSLAIVFAVPRSIAKAERARRLESGWHTHKPDIDNVVKLVLDALNGAAYGDDTQVVSMSSTKRWGAADGLTIAIGGGVMRIGKRSKDKRMQTAMFLARLGCDAKRAHRLGGAFANIPPWPNPYPSVVPGMRPRKVQRVPMGTIEVTNVGR